MTLIQLDVDTRQNPRHFTTAQANLEACLGARDTLTSLIALPTHRSLSLATSKNQMHIWTYGINFQTNDAFLYIVRTNLEKFYQISINKNLSINIRITPIFQPIFV